MHRLILIGSQTIAALFTVSLLGAQRPPSVAHSRDSIERRIEELEKRILALEENSGNRIGDAYGRIRRGIVLVQSGLQQGTGFIVQAVNGRFVVTNHHVVAGGQPISIVLDSVTRVPALSSARIAPGCPRRPGTGGFPPPTIGSNSPAT